MFRCSNCDWGETPGSIIVIAKRLRRTRSGTTFRTANRHEDKGEPEKGRTLGRSGDSEKLRIIARGPPA